MSKDDSLLNGETWGGQEGALVGAKRSNHQGGVAHFCPTMLAPKKVSGTFCG